MDACYREVNCSSSIILPPYLGDVLDLGASIEGESATSSTNRESPTIGGILEDSASTALEAGAVLAVAAPAASKDRVATAGPVHTADEATSMEWAGATV